MSLPPPRYTIWQALMAALALSKQAIEEVRALARVPGPVGPPGPSGIDGKDGFNADWLDWDLDMDTRTMTMIQTRGTETKRTPKKMAGLPLYRGVYKDGVAYEHGDEVTFGGSMFIALQDTNSRPETDNTWQLNTKRGRDGKDKR